MTRTHDPAGQSSRRERLRELMDRLDLYALLLERSRNFTWYTNGADNRVDHASPIGVAGDEDARDSEYVPTNNIRGRAKVQGVDTGFR